MRFQDLTAFERFVSRPQVDLWTETLASEEYDALAMMIAKGVTTEVETTEALSDSADSSSTRKGGEEEGEEGLRTTVSVGGKLLRVTRYYTEVQAEVF